MHLKIAGFSSLLAGWLLVVAALVLLPESPARAVFIVAGIGVEGLGLGLSVRGHMTPGKR